jgi:hypothetical protein
MCLPHHVLPLYVHTYNYRVTATIQYLVQYCVAKSTAPEHTYTQNPLLLSLEELGDPESWPQSVHH